MKIVNINLREQEQNQSVPSSSSLLQKGSVFKGKIVEIAGEYVTIITEEGQLIKGRSDISLSTKNNRELFFLVKFNDSNKIVLSFLSGEENVYLNYNIEEMLKMNDIKPTQSRIEVVKELINCRMPVNKQTIENGVKIYKKLVELINSDDDTKILMMNSEKDILNEDILKLIINKYDSHNFNGNELTLNNIALHKGNIIKASYLKKELNNAIENNSSQELIKGIVFLLRSNVKLSVNNIKYLFNILAGHNILEEDFNELEILLSKHKNSKNEKLGNIFRNPNGRVNINLSNLSKKNLQEYFNILRENIKILANLQLEKNKSKNAENKINEINNKIEFLKEINSFHGFYYIPFKIDKYNFMENIFFLKKNRMDRDKNYKVFITLNTNKLELVKVACEMSRRNINIEFEIEKNCVHLFKREEHILRQVLYDNGFVNTVIHYNSNKKISPLELLDNNQYLNYLLDVRV